MSEGQCFNVTHVANPVHVNASPICNIGEPNGAGQVLVVTEDGSHHVLTPEMLSRIAPQHDDYVVIQSDGYIYVNPKAVFERKYSPIGIKNAA
jgi:hypothetical protein